VSAPKCLQISESRRYIVRDDGERFFWLGDTAWELFHRLNREDADHYLRDRAAKQFTVIQAVALAELDGLNTPNAYGHRPLIDNDPAQPDLSPSGYWEHVDYIVDRANSLGLVVGFLPTWGRYWKDPLGSGGIFTPDNAEMYGRWLGKRYRHASLVWILGGDRPVENDTHRQIIRRMAAGLSDGDGGTHLRTFHSQGAAGSAQFFHDEPWLDFNFRQNSHAIEYRGWYDQTVVDYRRMPIKPVIDGEPVYEDVPVDLDLSRARATAHDARRALYWDLFSGACGHTYGHNSVWQMWRPGHTPILGASKSWRDALQSVGARQMRFARTLFESRHISTLVPDQTILAPDQSAVTTGPPILAARDESGRFAMIYAPGGAAVTVRRNVFKSDKIVATWFNPNDGQITRRSTLPNTDEQRFTAPSCGLDTDWILMIDRCESLGAAAR